MRSEGSDVDEGQGEVEEECLSKEEVFTRKSLAPNRKGCIHLMVRWPRPTSEEKSEMETASMKQQAA